MSKGRRHLEHYAGRTAEWFVRIAAVWFAPNVAWGLAIVAASLLGDWMHNRSIARVQGAVESITAHIRTLNRRASS